MSVLNFPRIYLNGHMFWNPPTANNNDALPLYDAVRMDLNWQFLNSYDINPQNAPEALMPWTIRPLSRTQVPHYVLQVPTNASNFRTPFMPAEWDLFGDNACGTVSYKDTQSTIIGGELQANTYIDRDPLVSKSFQLLGNPFGSQAPTPARFVDISPWQNTFTALYFDKLVLGDAQCGLTLNRQYRMLDRFLNFNWASTFGGLSYVTTTWQTCFARENLDWAVGDSLLLQQLQQQMIEQGAKGLMFRFSTYLTYYDKNGVFNDFPPVNTHSSNPEDVAQVQRMYEQGLNNVADIFYNPAYSSTAGTLGLWFDDEFPTAPAGRRLVPAEPVPVYKTTPGDMQDTKATLGVIPVQITGDTLSLDLSNGIPFYPVDPKAPIAVAEKFNAGILHLGVRQEDRFISAVMITYPLYRQSAFNQRSGILDVPLTVEQKNLLESGPLELQKLLASAEPVIAATQRQWTAEVVESGGFIDVGDHKTLTIMVQKDGKPAPEGTELLVAEYGNAYMVTTSDYYLAFSNEADFTLFYDYPEEPTLNRSNRPQFIDTPVAVSYLATGSGRRLTDRRTVVTSNTVPEGEPVGYQQFLDQPITVNLRPCLVFDNAIAQTGTLRDETATSSVNYSIARIRTDASGVARLGIRAEAPGFPTLRFFLPEGGKMPAVPFSFNYSEAYTDCLAPLRVLPLEPKLQQDFIDYWNTIYRDLNASQLMWNNFIYPQILQPFYYLYPIMNKFMPLNSQQRVEGAIDQLIVLISKEYQEESTLSMPITRDMSQSRRAVLELWANALVKHNYPPMPLSMKDFPPC
ncbi:MULTISPECIES: hypothetical protein [Pseudomonas]|uniref:hypothetical protein n=1 Tax=Pseudomonas TaxID=286 RepID=UPI000B34E17F|nr:MULTISPECIES: hypothetical protein [Pseudomonas]PMY59633.1 hypothetical protein C1Y31_30895 [Pseudomonas sp. FW305-25]PMY60862.1 hypothetical protein C1Y32_30665 [Pseudomonas sp. FW126-L8]PNA70117.1 hypothetical protein C1Y33_30660 [Pseudomonas sp. FW305-76]